MARVISIVYAINVALRYATVCLLKLVEILEMTAVIIYWISVELAMTDSFPTNFAEPAPSVRDNKDALRDVLMWAHHMIYCSGVNRMIGTTRSRLEFIHSVLTIKPSLLLVIGVFYVSSVLVGARLLLRFSQLAERKFDILVLRVRKPVDWTEVHGTFARKAHEMSKVVLQSVDWPMVSESIPQKATEIGRIFKNHVEKISLRKNDPPKLAPEDHPVPVLQNTLRAIEKKRANNVELEPEDFWRKIEEDFGKDNVRMLQKRIAERYEFGMWKTDPKERERENRGDGWVRREEMYR